MSSNPIEYPWFDRDKIFKQGIQDYAIPSYSLRLSSVQP